MYITELITSHVLFLRLFLAGLHYNENSDRVQASTVDGPLQYGIRHPKYKKGGHTVRKVKPTIGPCIFNEQHPFKHDNCIKIKMQ